MRYCKKKKNSQNFIILLSDVAFRINPTLRMLRLFLIENTNPNKNVYVKIKKNHIHSSFRIFFFFFLRLRVVKMPKVKKSNGFVHFQTLGTLYYH